MRVRVRVRVRIQVRVRIPLRGLAGVFAACIRCSKASRETGAAGAALVSCLPPHLVCAERIRRESASAAGVAPSAAVG